MKGMNSRNSVSLSKTFCSPIQGKFVSPSDGRNYQEIVRVKFFAGVPFCLDNIARRGQIPGDAEFPVTPVHGMRRRVPPCCNWDTIRVVAKSLLTPPPIVSFVLSRASVSGQYMCLGLVGSQRLVL